MQGTILVNSAYFISKKDFMRKVLTSGIIILLAVVLSLTADRVFFKFPVVCYVDSSKLIQKASLAKPAKDSLSSLEEKLQFQKSVLEDSLNLQIERIKKQHTSAGKAKIVEMQNELRRRNQNLTKHNQASIRKLAVAERDLYQGPIREINRLIEQYRIKHGYSLILGTNSNGGIVAADEHLDITDDVLTYLELQKNE